MEDNGPEYAIYSMVNDDDDDIPRERRDRQILLRCRYRHVVTRPHEINNDGSHHIP